MGLCGNGALVLNFDVEPDAIAAHDHWHTQEHMPERVSIPGFLRGTRWVAATGTPRYFVLYEVRDVAVLTSPEYLARLNQPSAWTKQSMAHMRGMRRGFCRVVGSVGVGFGHTLLQIHCATDPERRPALHAWLLHDALPTIARAPGFVSAHLFESALEPPMTDEQRLRGRDAAVDTVLVVSVCDAAVVDRIAPDTLTTDRWAAHGAAVVPGGGRFELDCVLSHADVAIGAGVVE